MSASTPIIDSFKILVNFGTLIPLRQGDKAPLISRWQCEDYIGLTPEAALEHIASGGNVGLRCDGLMVLDLDVSPGELPCWRELCQAAPEIGYGWWVVTPRGGLHVYLRRPDGVPPRRIVRWRGQPLDVTIGPRGYVVIPPSVVDGREYTWSPGHHPLELPSLPIASAELANAITGADPSPQPATSGVVVADVDWEAERLITESDTLTEGQRNVGLTSLAGRLRNLGMEAEQLEMWLRQANERLCRPPLPEAEVRTIAASIAQREVHPPRKPRRPKDYVASTAAAEYEAIEDISDTVWYRRAGSGEPWTRLTDAEARAITGELCQRADIPPEQQPHESTVLTTLYAVASRVPRRNWFLAAVQPHPDDELLTTWLPRVWGMSTAHPAYALARAAGRVLAIAIAARQSSQGPVQYDYLIHLVGPQGCGKTTFCRLLAAASGVPDAYYELVGDLLSRDTAMALSRAVVAEVAEGIAMRRADAAALKTLITRTYTQIRRPYGRILSPIITRAVLVATANRPEIPPDETGQRRHVVIPLTGSLDRAAMAELAPRALAAGLAAWQAGEQPILPADVTEMAVQLAKAYTRESPDTALLADALTIMPWVVFSGASLTALARDRVLTSSTPGRLAEAVSGLDIDICRHRLSHARYTVISVSAAQALPTSAYTAASDLTACILRYLARATDTPPPTSAYAEVLRCLYPQADHSRIYEAASAAANAVASGKPGGDWWVLLGTQ